MEKEISYVFVFLASNTGRSINTTIRNRRNIRDSFIVKNFCSSFCATVVSWLLFFPFQKPGSQNLDVLRSLPLSQWQKTIAEWSWPFWTGDNSGNNTSSSGNSNSHDEHNDDDDHIDGYNENDQRRWQQQQKQ